MSIQEYKSTLFKFDELELSKQLDTVEALLMDTTYKTLTPEEQSLTIAKAMEVIYKYVNENKHVNENNSYPAITVVLGTTGGGKSTLINYLVGSKIHVRWDQDQQEAILEIPKPIMKVCHGLDSCTFAPEFYEDKTQNLVYLDCPGFLDSKGVVHEILNALSIQKAIKCASKVNFIVTVTEAAISTRVGITELKSTIDSLESFAKDFEKFQDSILLVITKGKHSTIRDDIKYAEVHLKQALLRSDLSEYQKKFIQFVVENKKFQFSFKSPVDEMDGQIISTEAKDKIALQIKQLKPVDKPSEFDIKISPDAKNRVTEFADLVNNNIKSSIEKFGIHVHNNIMKQRKDSSDIKQLETDLTFADETLKNIGTFNNVTEFVNQLQSWVNDNKRLINNNNANIESLSEILKQEDILSLFQKINPELKNTYQTDAWKLSLSSIQDTIKMQSNWYKLFNAIKEILSSEKIQLNKNKYNVKDVEEYGDENIKLIGNIHIDKNNLNAFLEKFAKIHKDELNKYLGDRNITDIVMNSGFKIEDIDLHIEELNQLLQMTLIEQSICSKIDDNSLIIKGTFPRLSEIKEKCNDDDIKASQYVSVYGLNTVFINQDLVLPGKNMNWLRVNIS